MVLASGDPFSKKKKKKKNPQHKNVLVFVENVFQIATTNYTLIPKSAKTNTIARIISVGATTVIQTSTHHGYAPTDSVQILELNAPGDAVENQTTVIPPPTSHSIVSIPAQTE